MTLAVGLNPWVVLQPLSDTDMPNKAAVNIKTLRVDLLTADDLRCAF